MASSSFPQLPLLPQLSSLSSGDTRGTKRRADEISVSNLSSLLLSGSNAAPTGIVGVDESEDVGGGDYNQEERKQRTKFLHELESKAETEIKNEAEYWTCVPGPLASQCIGSRRPGFEEEWLPRFRKNTPDFGSSSNKISNSSIYLQYPTEQECKNSCVRRMPRPTLWNMAPMLSVQDLQSLKLAATREISKELQQTATADKLRQDVLRQIRRLKIAIDDPATAPEIIVKAIDDLWKLLTFGTGNVVVGSGDTNNIGKGVSNLFTMFSPEISREIVDAALSYPAPGDGYESPHLPHIWLGFVAGLLKLSANDPRWIIPNESRLRILVASPEGKDRDQSLQQKIDLVGAGLMDTINPLNPHDQENVVFALQKALSLDSEVAEYERKVLYKYLIQTDQTVADLWSSYNLYYVPESRPESKRTLLESLVAKWKKLNNEGIQLRDTGTGGELEIFDRLVDEFATIFLAEANPDNSSSPFKIWDKAFLTGMEGLKILIAQPYFQNPADPAKLIKILTNKKLRSLMPHCYPIGTNVSGELIYERSQGGHFCRQTYSLWDPELLTMFLYRY